MGMQSATDARAQIIEEQFWAVVANIPGAVYRCACQDDWPIRFISDHIELLCGYPAADFVDNAVRTYGSIIHPHDRPDVAVGDEPGLPLKPDPALIVHHILPRYPHLRRERLLMVGDTEMDIQFAKAGGISCCWASYGYGETERCRALAPEYEISSIEALPALALS